MQNFEEVLSFWFGQKPVRWFKKDPAFDQEIRQGFETRLQEAAKGKHDSWMDSAQGSLALVILLDQFPRNIYRDTPQAFAFDAKARRVTLQALSRKFDQELKTDERTFLYLPLEHSESVEDQKRCVALFEDMATRSTGKEQDKAKDFLTYAQRHKEIIDRFGRFPHRNKILGRKSTAEEEQFLKGPNSSF